MKYFKVVYWNDTDFIPIEGNELHKAFALSLDQDGRGLFTGGMIQGKDIKRIIPDWHREFGWNPTHKLDDQDWNEIKVIEKDYQHVLEKGKIIAEYALKENRRDLLSMPAKEAVMFVPLKIQEDNKVVIELSERLRIK